MDQILDILSIVIECALLVILVVMLIKSFSKDGGEDNEDTQQAVKDGFNTFGRELREEISGSVQTNVRNLGDSISALQKSLGERQDEKLAAMDERLNRSLENMNTLLSEKQTESANTVKSLLDSMENRLKTLEANNEQKLEAIRKTVDDKLREIQDTVNMKLQSALDDKMKNLGQMLSDNQKRTGDSQNQLIGEMDKKLTGRLGDMSKTIADRQEQSGKAVGNTLDRLEKRFGTFESNTVQKLEEMRTSVNRSLADIQQGNQKKLDEIQNTVNKKLDEHLRESFKMVSERLEKVYNGLGEMQALASGVGDLKKVLSGVKSRGILGEIQLAGILEDILSPDQYEREVPTIPDSRERVEFAVKLPGQTDDKPILLPIDSKFPGDTYGALQDAYESGERERIDAAKKTLVNVIMKCAKDIEEKYIKAPYTTNFGIMFLPFEGLYAEVVNTPGLVEALQKKHHVNVTGPSTMAAMLNSLQMGFRTLALQKRSGEVWKILGEVKAEFGTFEEALQKAQKHIRQVDDDLDKLIGTRTRQLNRKLDKIDTLEEFGAQELLPAKQ